MLSKFGGIFTNFATLHVECVALGADQRSFPAGVVDTNQRNVRGKDARCRGIGPVGDVDFVSHRGLAQADSRDQESQNGPLPHGRPKLNLIHTDGDKLKIRIFQRGRHPSDFVDPHQHVTAKEEPEMVEIFGHN